MLSISIAPNPPTIMSSSTCSASERNESSLLGELKFWVRYLIRCSASAGSVPEPALSCTCQRIPAMRSLIVLIAFRATGVSANRRKFIGDSFGYTSGRGP